MAFGGKKTILLTGATGFVGSRVCARLMADGYDLRCAIREESQDGNSVVVGDISSETPWGDALMGVSAVIHLAACVNVMNANVNDQLTEFRRVNVAGTLNLARQAAVAGVERFIFLSTVKVIGEETAAGQPFTEKDETRPQGPYGITKLEAEMGMRRLAEESDMEVVIIRPPLVYGPCAKGNFGNMQRWVHKGIPLPLGTIHNQRSLIAIDNLVDFIITCIAHPAAGNETFLVADGENLSTTELLRRAGKAMSKPARLFPMPEWLLKCGARMLGKQAMAQRLCGNLQVDISKAREVLGWSPPLSVDEGLRRAVCGTRSEAHEKS
ncbi:SDR family oxidoreductase [Desulfuromonas sp. KJ2020]|uniref:UDP-glucose 4-epimerase family protein n=1 Tax=Desulfuromonas sp. KJ2020 TaxID=2919173 RepID=UPI0020A7F2F3|nr:SDR family oxidoreductase [Desulfuromonas sp. KJ2020]MCP3177494.1 SDR family oxidoreductase [Desulfuromonas sp. KJ2020]